MKRLSLTLLFSSLVTTQCFATSSTLSADFEGGFFQNSNGFTTYSGYSSASNDRVSGSTRNIKQEHKLSWTLGLSHMLQDNLQVRGAFFINDHHFADHMHKGAGSIDSLVTTRMPSGLNKAAAGKAHSRQHMNTQIMDVRLSREWGSEDIRWTPHVGLERAKVKYEQITDYQDLNPGGAFQRALVKESSRAAGVGPSLGLALSYALSSDWALNVAGDFSLLVSEVSTKFKTTNNYGDSDYDERSEDKKEAVEHIKTMLSFSRGFNLFNSTLQTELGYRYDVFHNAVKTLTFTDDNLTNVGIGSFHDYSFSGPFVKFGMDIL